MIIQALRKGLIEHEARDTGGVPRWKSSCPDRLAEGTNRISMVGPARLRFCCLQYHIKPYVRSCCTTAVVVGLCSCYIQLHMRCCGCPLLHRFPCRYEVAYTTAEALPLCTTTVVVIAFSSSVFSYTKNQSRPTKKALLWERSGILSKQLTCVSGIRVYVCT